MKNKFQGENLIIVGGVPRSGITLVQNMLDSHPDIYGLPEFKIFTPIIRLRNLIQNWASSDMIDPSLTSHENINQNFSELINMFFTPLFSERKEKYLSEKTPNNVAVFPELIDLLPEARHIFVVRDPRAVILSLLQVRKRVLMQGKDMEVIRYTENFNGVRSAIEFNQRLLENGFNVVKKAQGKILVVIYEHIVRDPEAGTKRICEFLNIDWSEQMKYPGKFKHPAEGFMSRERASPWYDIKKFQRDPEIKEIEKWKTQLPISDQIRIAKAFQGFKELEDLEYDFSLDYLSPTQRLKGQIQASIRESLGNTRTAFRRFINKII